jgi:uncharacterized membrane protein
MAISKVLKSSGLLITYFLLIMGWIKYMYTMSNDSIYVNNWIIPVIVSYILIILNMVFILIPYSKKLNNLSEKLLIFGISGLVIYGVYNATTLGLSKSHSYLTVLIDVMFGIISHLIACLLINYTNL